MRRFVLLAFACGACAWHIRQPDGREIDTVWVHGKVEACQCPDTKAACATTDASLPDPPGIQAVGAALAAIIGALAFFVT